MFFDVGIGFKEDGQKPVNGYFLAATLPPPLRHSLPFLATWRLGVKLLRDTSSLKIHERLLKNAVPNQSGHFSTRCAGNFASCTKVVFNASLLAYFA